jgi:hypothetical protein
VGRSALRSSSSARVVSLVSVRAVLSRRCVLHATQFYYIHARACLHSISPPCPHRGRPAILFTRRACALNSSRCAHHVERITRFIMAAVLALCAAHSVAGVAHRSITASVREHGRLPVSLSYGLALLGCLACSLSPLPCCLCCLSCHTFTLGSSGHSSGLHPRFAHRRTRSALALVVLIVVRYCEGSRSMVLAVL